MANLNFNKATLGGRLTADPELKTTQNGTPVCTFSVAVNRKANREETDFINCVAWQKTGEFISKYFKKGSCILVCGAIQTRSWTDNSGGKRYATEVIVDDAYFVDSRNEVAPQQQTSQFPGAQEISDDDMPF